MTLKPITLRLDEEEYEKLKGYLSEFGDPDINVAYVVRSYIRDLNRALPFIVKSDWDLKNYFALLGSWLKRFSSMTEVDMFAKMAANPWSIWENINSFSGRGTSGSTAEEMKPNEKKNDGKKIPDKK